MTTSTNSKRKNSPSLKKSEPHCILIWHDAHDDTGDTWVEVKDIDQSPCVMTSIGFLLPNAKPGHVSVAQTRSGAHFNNIIHVLDAMVIELITID